MSAIIDHFHRRWGLPLIIAVTMVTMVLAVPAAVRASQATASESAWASIQVLDLETAVKIALADNPSLAAARARTMQAAMAVKQAKSAYWPQLEAKAGGSWVDMSEREVQQQEASFQALGALSGRVSALEGAVGIPSPPGFGAGVYDFNNPEYYYNAGLTATWLVFNGFARKFSVAAARYGEEASVQAHADSRRQIISAVVLAYLSAQLAKENLAIAKADAEFNNRQLTESRLRYDVGAGALSDVLNFQVRGNAAQTQIIVSEYDYERALTGLAVLLGSPQGKLPDHISLADFETTTELELASPEFEASLQTALENRSDIHQLKAFIDSAEATVNVAKGDYYPSLFLSAGIEGQRPEDLGFEGDDFGSTVALGLSWKLFTGGLTRARIGEGKAKVSELQYNLDSIRNGVAQEIQSIVALIRSAQLQVDLQEKSTELVLQQRDLVEKEYKSGVGSLVRLNEAQKELTVAQGRLVLARVGLRQAWYSLQTATGHILEMFQAQ